MTRPIAFVTGASRGIGKAIALALAKEGYDLAISARTVNPGEQRDNTLTVHKTDTQPLPGSLSETAAQVEAEGAKSLVIPMDLLDRASVGAGAQKILDEWGRVDLLVHNGRYIGPGLMDVFMDTPIDAYEKFVEAHAIAPIILTKAFLPGMLERGQGQVVTITSGAAFEVPPAPAGQGGWGLGYAIGKGSGHQLVGVLHAEFKDKGIRAYNVEPGFVGTERNEIVVKEFGHDISHAAPPAAIGAVVAWVATSNEATQLAGTCIDGQNTCLERNLYPDWR